MQSSSRPLFGTAHGTRFWINTDVCGLLCATLVYFLLWLASALVHKTVLPPARSTADAALLISFDVIALLALVSHWRTMTTDPGAVPHGAEPPPDYDEDSGAGSLGFSDKLESGTLSMSALGEAHARRRRRALARTRECNRCKGFRPERAYHCNVCNRCVVKMDHHCPWANNCIGLSNHKQFLLFLFYVFALCSASAALVVRRNFFVCWEVGPAYRGAYPHNQHRVLPPRSLRVADSLEAATARGNAALHGRHLLFGHGSWSGAGHEGGNSMDFSGIERGINGIGGVDGSASSDSSALRDRVFSAAVAASEVLRDYPWFFARFGRKPSASLHSRDRCRATKTSLLEQILLVIVSLLFGMFSGCMMFDQSAIVTENTTTIDRLMLKSKEKARAKKGGTSAVAHRKGLGSSEDTDEEGGGEGAPMVHEVFGGYTAHGCRWHWLCPTLAQFPLSLRDEVYGFMVPPQRNSLVSSLNSDSSCSSNSSNLSNLHNVDDSPIIQSGDDPRSPGFRSMHGENQDAGWSKARAVAALWTQVPDATGEMYWWNEATGETSWEAPPDVSMHELLVHHGANFQRVGDSATAVAQAAVSASRTASASAAAAATAAASSLGWSIGVPNDTKGKSI